MENKEEIEIERLSKCETIDFQTEHVKTAMCCQIINRKFKVIVLTFLIFILLLEIFKIVLPALSQNDQRLIAETMLNSIKRLSNRVKKWYEKSNDNSDAIEEETTIPTSTYEIETTTSNF